jgi:hypothetical protein
MTTVLLTSFSIGRMVRCDPLPPLLSLSSCAPLYHTRRFIAPPAHHSARAAPLSALGPQCCTSSLLYVCTALRRRTLPSPLSAGAFHRPRRSSSVQLSALAALHLHRSEALRQHRSPSAPLSAISALRPRCSPSSPLFFLAALRPHSALRSHSAPSAPSRPPLPPSARCRRSLPPICSAHARPPSPAGRNYAVFEPHDGHLRGKCPQG